MAPLTLYSPVAASLLYPEPKVISNFSSRDSSRSAKANAAVIKRMSRTERLSDGRYSDADIAADWAVQRARVRARYGCERFEVAA